jgi:hypothetical protein
MRLLVKPIRLLSGPPPNNGARRGATPRPGASPCYEKGTTLDTVSGRAIGAHVRATGRLWPSASVIDLALIPGGDDGRP